jgi:hypothetical protein
VVPELLGVGRARLDRLQVDGVLNSETLAALGAARVDHSAPPTGLHANQKAMGTGAAGLGRLVGALHGRTSNLLKVFIRETHHYLKKLKCSAQKPQIAV